MSHNQRSIPDDCFKLNILALDPGGTTGWCFVKGAVVVPGVGPSSDSERQLDIVASQIVSSPLDREHLDKLPISDFHAAEASCVATILKLISRHVIPSARIAPPNEFDTDGWCTVEGIDERGHEFCVVSEDFVPRVFNTSRAFYSPMRINAMLASHMPSLPCHVPLFFQMPSLAMATISDDYLKSFGLFNKGEPHSNDATRHALTFLRRLPVSDMLLDGVSHSGSQL
jgi:hypothetical protein